MIGIRFVLICLILWWRLVFFSLVKIMEGVVLIACWYVWFWLVICWLRCWIKVWFWWIYGVVVDGGGVWLLFWIMVCHVPSYLLILIHYILTTNWIPTTTPPTTFLNRTTFHLLNLLFLTSLRSNPRILTFLRLKLRLSLIPQFQLIQYQSLIPLILDLFVKLLYTLFCCFDL